LGAPLTKYERKTMWENIKHEQYKGHDIRSSPRKDLMEEKWKIRIDITSPPFHGTTKMREYLDEKVYVTMGEAHTSGFEMGRRIIDERIQTGRIPSS
jgi:hypothetical protein